MLKTSHEILRSLVCGESVHVHYVYHNWEPKLAGRDVLSRRLDNHSQATVLHRGEKWCCGWIDVPSGQLRIEQGLRRNVRSSLSINRTNDISRCAALQFHSLQCSESVVMSSLCAARVAAQRRRLATIARNHRPWTAAVWSCPNDLYSPYCALFRRLATNCRRSTESSSYGT